MPTFPSPERFVEAAWLEVRYARRVLAGTPAFTLTALVTLTLALGVNTAVFALVNAVLLKPLPYPSPERLHLLSLAIRQDGPSGGNTAVDGRTWELVRDRAPAVPLIHHFVWGVSLSDPTTYAGVAVLLLSVATVASVAPALRILGLDPATTLRQE